MSYSIDVPEGPKHDLAERVIAALEQHRATRTVDAATPALDDHLVAVTAAVPALAAQVGRPEDHVTVRIVGHANPMHAPPDGYGDESCGVMVSVVRPA